MLRLNLNSHNKRDYILQAGLTVQAEYTARESVEDFQLSESKRQCTRRVASDGRKHNLNMLAIASLAALTTAAGIYWFLNRHKPFKHVVSELRYTLDMQGAGVAGLIDDWVNIRRNKVVLPDANKKIAVITGGARGIGTEVIRGLLKANMIVVMGIRQPDQSRKLKETMQNGEYLHAFELDLQSLKSVKAFAANVLKNFPKIHILVNNAGIMFGDYKLTEDGIETQLAVNHLSHFYLTHLLLPALKMGGTIEESARVVNVTSCAHYPGKIYFDDINMKEHYDTTAAYAQSKLAQLMSARYINQLVAEEGCRVKCYSVHPGIVDTDLFEKTLFKRVFPWAMKAFFKTPERGAISILHACFNKDLEKKGGLYISNCIEGISNRFSKNVDNQKKLFEVSCKLTQVNVEDFGKEC